VSAKRHRVHEGRSLGASVLQVLRDGARIWVGRGSESAQVMLELTKRDEESGPGGFLVN
jgi:hypothetical protein